jgi:hypothetical protein
VAAAEPPQPRKPLTYGNWRKPKTAGLGPLGLASTIVLLGGLIVVVLSMLISMLLAIALSVLVVMAVAPLALTDRHDRTLLTRLVVRFGWRHARKSGAYLYRSGPLGRTGHGTCTLPGLAVSSTMSEAQDAYGRPFGMLSYPSSNHHVVVISCAADGDALVDEHQIDVWVAHWGEWLAGLAVEPGLVGAAVTVETAPDSGLRLQQEVNGQLSHSAPQLARDMLAEAMETYPAGSAHITTRIALAYSGAARDGRARKDNDAMALLLGQQLPHLTSRLGMTGAGTARPMSATEITEAVRTAYDPAVAPLVEEAQEHGGSGLTWEDAGPAGTEESWEHYRHDSAWSTTWQMSEAPRGEVVSSVLTKLLVPHPDIDRKRITLHYRPHDPATAARIVERDVLVATFRAGQQKVAKARSTVAVQSAEQSAQEEAMGAGVVRFALSVTATVSDFERLPQAVAAVDNLAPQTRLRLRRVAGSQASAFAATLPIGLVLPHHLTVPASIRDQL